MKYLLYTLLFCLPIVGQAQTETAEKSVYEKLLDKNVGLLDKAKDVATFEDALKRFERLKKNAPDKWLPLYYTAYCKIRLVRWNNNEQGLDEAIADLKKAQECNKNPENLALLARAYMKKIELNISNGPKYTNVVKTTLQEAIQLNDKNPRVYLIYGRYYYYFPKFVGGDKDKALQLFEKAAKLFEKQEEESKGKFTPQPHWGKNLNAWQLSHY